MVDKIPSAEKQEISIEDLITNPTTEIPPVENSTSEEEESSQSDS